MQKQEKKSASAGAVFGVYWRHVRQHPLTVFLVVAGVAGMQIADLIAPLYLKQFFNTLAAHSPSVLIKEELLGILWIIALFWIARLIANRLEHFSNVYMEARVMADLYATAFEYLIAHSYNFFTSRFAGSLTHKTSKFARGFETMFDSIILQFFPTALFVTGAVGVLFIRNHVLGIALGIWAVCFVLFQIWLARLRQPIRVARSQADTLVTATLADAIGNQNTVTLFSGTQHESVLFKKVVEVWRKATVRSWFTDALIWGALGIFIVSIEIGLLYGAIIYWSRGLLTLGDFVLIQTYLFTTFDRLTSINNELRRFFDAFSDAGEMVEILQTPHEVQDAVGAKNLVVSRAEISFKNVGFQFNENQPILESFSLAIPGGQKVALVGPSGAGKSTVTKLLLRLFDVKSGTIEIDGQNIANVTQNSVRDAIAFVPQEPILFHRTLMENIRYGRREASDKEVLDAARKAHCDEFISALPERYNTFVGERGIKLSGGERQRVAIARAILKNSPILVLDEATSSLDSESEALIQDALRVLMEHKTVIVIAHRLSTIMKMDRIVVLDGGTIVADGTHQELLEQGGLYHKLWSIQAGGFLIDDDKELQDEASLLE